jgi:hypothetical protein
MPTIYTDIEIDAPRPLVWDALVQKNEWVRWNTFLFDRDPRKHFKQGQSLILSLKRMAQERETEFQAQVTLLQPESCLRWISTAPGYRSEHLFELQDIGTNRTQYRHHERISGILSNFFLLFIRQDEHNGMRRMAFDLKQYAEWLQAK